MLHGPRLPRDQSWGVLAGLAVCRVSDGTLSHLVMSERGSLSVPFTLSPAQYRRSRWTHKCCTTACIETHRISMSGFFSMKMKRGSLVIMLIILFCNFPSTYCYHCCKNTRRVKDLETNAVEFAQVHPCSQFAEQDLYLSAFSHNLSTNMFMSMFISKNLYC